MIRVYFCCMCVLFLEDFIRSRHLYYASDILMIKENNRCCVENMSITHSRRIYIHLDPTNRVPSHADKGRASPLRPAPTSK